MPEILAFIWLGVVVLFVVLEAATAQLVSIWFVAGAVVALIAGMCGADILLQIALFLIVSVVALAATRPLVRKLTAKKMERTNADRVIGMTAIVTEEIDNERGVGLVNVAGAIWSARTADQTIAPKGCNVQVQSIQGVKLLVIPVKTPEDNKG